MHRLTSRDGTSIAYTRQGAGPAVILVGGGLDNGSENAPLAQELADRFTVFNYARRGRGESGDTVPYALQREIEDLEAVIAEAGGSACVYGVSTGGALVQAAAEGIAIDRLAVYEVPYNTSDEWSQQWLEYVRQLEAVLAEGRRGDAVELFMRLAGSSDEEVAGARSSPMWHGLEELAHTLAYDAACLGDGRPPVARLAKITRPTLVATGVGAREAAAADWVRALDEVAEAVAASIPHAERVSLEGQMHVIEPKTFAPVLAQFFGS